jgi:hypothetical protein
LERIEVPAMLGLTQRLSLVPELLPDAPPPGPGPVRFSLDRVPEARTAGIYREFIGRSVARLNIEPMRDAPFEADFTLQSLPGLQLISRRVHGSCNRRTRERPADGQDDFTLAVNLRGPLSCPRARERSCSATVKPLSRQQRSLAALLTTLPAISSCSAFPGRSLLRW